MVKYLYCDKCGGYYVLKDGESPDELSDKCECGGKLVYGEMKENKSLSDSFIDFWKDSNKFKKVIIFFIVILILLLIYASQNGLFEPKTHYNNKGLSFDYPSKYNVDISEDATFLVNGIFASHLVLLVDKTNRIEVLKFSPSLDKNSLIQFISSLAYDYYINNTDGKIVSQKEIKIDNINGNEITYDFNKNKEVPTTEFIYFTKNNSDYILIFASTDLGTMQSDINMIINSFHVN